MLLPSTQFAAVASGLSGSSWGLIAAIATAAVAVATLVLRELQRRRADLDQKVANAVNASIGRTLLEYREFEIGVRASLEEAVESATQIQLQLQERLSGSEAQSARLGELLDNASDLVPRLETSRSAIPSLLVSEALRAATPEEGLGSLSALLASHDAGADNLELAGDIARQNFGADALALALYERAVQINPARVAAEASLILLQTNAGSLPLDEGRIRISNLAKANPDNRNAISEALNLYTTYDDYAGMLELVDELLTIDEQKALLWRNRAIALSHLGRRDEVEAAYARSYEIASSKGDVDERSNTARPYASFLIEREKYDDASRILEGALAGDPAEARLLLTLGDLWDRREDRQRALRCYEAALAIKPNPNEARIILDRRERLVLRARFVEEGILKGDAYGPGSGSARSASGDAV